MAQELEILEKLKAGKPLTEDDKEHIYSAHSFLMPGSNVPTTLLRQIILFLNSDQILTQLDSTDLIKALLTVDKNLNSSELSGETFPHGDFYPTSSS